MDPHMMIPTYLPFYAFSLFTHSVHSGRVGHFKEASDPSSGELSSIEFDFIEGRIDSSTHSQLHPNVLVYSPTFELVTTPDYDLMQEIWFWNVDDSVLKPKANTKGAKYALPLPPRPNGVRPSGSHDNTSTNTSIDVKVLHSATMPEAWTYAKKKLLKNEKYCSDVILKRECSCDVVDDVKTDTTFSHVVVKLIYLPVYVWAHAYQGVTYLTVMNAQNGIVGGRRPYALKSSLDSCIKLLAGGSEFGGAKSDNITGVLSGADLALRDNYTEQNSPYRRDVWYLVFPPTDQFLVVVAVGWLRLQNVSQDQTVEVVAQKRLSSHVGRSLVLTPGQEQVVAYRGAWCLCVVSGDPQSVIISSISTNSGADKEDALGMV